MLIGREGPLTELSIEPHDQFFRSLPKTPLENHLIFEIVLSFP